VQTAMMKLIAILRTLNFARALDHLTLPFPLIIRSVIKIGSLHRNLLLDPTSVSLQYIK